jgi:serine/threonine-protein kinase
MAPPNTPGGKSDDAVLEGGLGRYGLLERMSVGSLAEVFRGYYTSVESFERPVVIKRALPSVCQDKKLLRLFVDEAHLIAQLQHPNIVQVLDFGRTQQGFFMVLEYVEGRDLGKVMERCRSVGVQMPMPLACAAALRLLDALDFAHGKSDDRGRPLSIVHRDLCPSNVLFSFEGDVKLTDFAVAGTAKRRCTRESLLKARASYVSPEHATSEKVDPRSDVFSVGAVLYEMIAGRPPFAAETPFATLALVRGASPPPLARFRAEVPAALESVLMKALAKRREDRHQSAGDMHAELMAVVVKEKLRAAHKAAGSWLLGIFNVEPAGFEEAATQVDVDRAVVNGPVETTGARDPSAYWKGPKPVPLDPTATTYRETPGRVAPERVITQVTQRVLRVVKRTDGG